MDLQTAADRLGVHYQTAYRWVRDGSLKAVKRGASYDITDADLENFQTERTTPAPPPRQATVRSWDHQVDRLYDLLAVGDELGARQAVDRLREGSIEAIVLCEALIGPVLKRVGDAWARGEVSVAEEHRASAICERLLARIAVHPRGRPRGICLVGTPPGDEHSLPAAMAAVALRADRWQVHHLGTQVPTDDLVNLARTLEADLVVLSLTNPAAQEVADRLADAVRAGTTSSVLVGAPGMQLSDLVATARQLRN
ncbi:MAG: cobalamin-dependent protein [Actinomycetota bacterium]|nr:cobalamin-dependent protein [Actinomycetota bacterium]